MLEVLLIQNMIRITFNDQVSFRANNASSRVAHTVLHYSVSHNIKKVCDKWI